MLNKLQNERNSQKHYCEGFEIKTTSEKKIRNPQAVEYKKQQLVFVSGFNENKQYLSNELNENHRFKIPNR